MPAKYLQRTMQLKHNSIKAGHFHVHDVQVLSADNMDILFS